MENAIDTNTNSRISKKTILVVGLVVVLLGIGLFMLFKRSKPNYERADLVKTELYVDPQLKDLASFVSGLPYQTEGFMIEYYPNSGFYFITLRGKSDQEVNDNKNKASDWIYTHTAFAGAKSFCGLKYQIVLPPKPANVEVVDIQKQVTMPGCEYTNPSNTN